MKLYLYSARVFELDLPDFFPHIFRDPAKMRDFRQNLENPVFFVKIRFFLIFHVFSYEK